MRCVLCGNRGRHARDGGWQECTHCALAYVPGHRPPDDIAADLSARFAAPRIDLRTDPPRDWRATTYTLRVAGYRFGRAATIAADGRSAGMSDLPRTGPPVALGILARPSELPQVKTLATRLAPRFARTIVLLDTDGAPRDADGGVTWAARCLDGDFASQRNHLHALADTPWMLQLDADEDIDTALADRLPGLAADADRHGLRTLALPRRNLVDGIASDLWPDVQYRLNRTDVRYRGRVHERPDAAADWTCSALAPIGAIDHALSGDRVRARTRLYGAMAPDGARLDDEAALLTPFDPD